MIFSSLTDSSDLITPTNGPHTTFDIFWPSFPSHPHFLLQIFKCSRLSKNIFYRYNDWWWHLRSAINIFVDIQNRYGHKLTIEAKLIFFTDIRYLVLTSVPLVMYKEICLLASSTQWQCCKCRCRPCWPHLALWLEAGRGVSSARSSGRSARDAEQRTRLVRPHRYHTYTEAVRSHFYKLIMTKAWLFWEGHQTKPFVFVVAHKGCE